MKLSATILCWDFIEIDEVESFNISLVTLNKNYGETLIMLIKKHGSFYLRNSWPTKCINAVIANPYIFSPNSEHEAVDELGVGRVMVKAMRYWMNVLGLSDENHNQRGVYTQLTDLANLIAENDLYCQKKGTLWILHRNIATNRENATAWYWGFNEYKSNVFSKKSFSDDFESFLLSNNCTYAKKAIEQEFDCFKNTYLSNKEFDITRILDEDTIAFFAPLQLIKTNEKEGFEKNPIHYSEIPVEVLLYCIIMDNKEYLVTNNQISYDSIRFETNQVGCYFNLSDSSLMMILQMAENLGYIKLFNNFGSRYIEFIYRNALGYLEKYYEQ